MDDKLKQMKKENDNIPIPEELDFVVRHAIKQGMKNNKNHKKLPKKITGGVAAAALIFVLGVNTSESFAASVKDVPVIGSLAKVVSFHEFKEDKETYKADIKVPAIQGLENTEFEASLNKKYMVEAQAQYEAFKEAMKYVESMGGGHIGVEGGYEVKTDNDQILSIERYEVSTSNGYSARQFDTIDKKNELLITLPSLFKDDNYIYNISNNIREQMIANYKKDSSNYYWVAGIVEKPEEVSFVNVDRNQSFYINNEGKLVICFDKYEVAPGAMGALEFIIPTEVIKDDLESNTYIK
ncbi:anti-sigma factor [Solibacillus sp. R5-41]|uniref:anti-sigma-V factor rsiV n=1 Tax=Solibacillus sp. R5-41 TaxID=2048654 RepID=UPI000C125C8F|nr:anti-sigma-V factor rsiV [Solibacillus sp. R5-41]ATP40333.1 anti-sigma factor [Solibacillus sp. R5-41]